MPQGNVLQKQKVSETKRKKEFLVTSTALADVGTQVSVPLERIIWFNYMQLFAVLAVPLLLLNLLLCLPRRR